MPPVDPSKDGTNGMNGAPQVSDGASDQERTDRTVRIEFSESNGTCPECGARTPDGHANNCPVFMREHYQKGER